MKPLIRRLMLYSVFAMTCMLAVSTSQAAMYSTTVFTKPGQYCVARSEWRGGLSQATFDHHLSIAGNDQFKNGDVFVGFRLRSRPDTLWLSEGGGKWSVYDASKDPVAYYIQGTDLQPVLPSSILPLPTELQPVMRISIIPQPTNLTAFSGDGELLVGYGLRNNTAATVKDSFQDMVNNHRFSVVWSIGAPLEHLGPICLTITAAAANSNDIVDLPMNQQ